MWDLPRLGIKPVSPELVSRFLTTGPWGKSPSASLSIQYLPIVGLGAGGEGDDRGWDGWMASLTRWTWVWVNSGRWWWTGRPGMLRFMGSWRVGHDWATELNWTEWMLLWTVIGLFQLLEPDFLGLNPGPTFTGYTTPGQLPKCLKSSYP